MSLGGPQCVRLLLCKFVGEEEGVGENKAVLCPRKPEIAIPFRLLAGVQVKRETAEKLLYELLSWTGGSRKMFTNIPIVFL